MDKLGQGQSYQAPTPGAGMTGANSLLQFLGRPGNAGNPIMAQIGSLLGAPAQPSSNTDYIKGKIDAYMENVKGKSKTTKGALNKLGQQILGGTK